MIDECELLFDSATKAVQLPIAFHCRYVLL